MSERSTRDRRPILNAIVGLLILGVAAALFWPRGGEDGAAVDSLVLTPDDAVEQPLQASVDDAATGEGEEDAPSEDPFPVEDAQLETEPTEAISTPSESVSQPQSRPIRSREIEPTASGAYFLVVGSYGESANADTEVARLSGAGIRASAVEVGGKYRVQVGYFQSREDAQSYGRKLKQSLNLDFWISSR